ncbi:hypothetical protein M0802_002398 [Mischocyttarus mexicanus]|nr:hypothetical protein M0802_002398 [Mischocyttarus mexicanus]
MTEVVFIVIVVVVIVVLLVLVMKVVMGDGYGGCRPFKLPKVPLDRTFEGVFLDFFLTTPSNHPNLLAYVLRYHKLR